MSRPALKQRLENGVQARSIFSTASDDDLGSVVRNEIGFNVGLTLTEHC